MDDFGKRFIAFIVCLILLMFGVYRFATGQELPKEPISKYVKDGVIYWHKDLPYYVFISDDSTGGMEMLKSKKYSNPAYFDTYGKNYIRTKWAVDQATHKTISPQQEILWEVYVDGQSPTTTPNFVSKSAYLLNGVRYFTKDLIMELGAEDSHSGVRSTYYSVNDSTYIKYELPINLNPTDTFNIKYFSVDNVGNYEKTKTFTYNADDYNVKYAIDFYAPETQLTSKFVGGKVLGPHITVSFSAKDKGSGVAFTNYMIDSGEVKVYTKPFTLNLLEGVHTLSWFSVDRVTNIEETKIKEFYFDNTKPIIYISAGNFYFSSDSVMYITNDTQIKLMANDMIGIEKVAYKFDDDKSYKLYTEPIKLPVDYHDKQNLKYFASDSTGNDSDIHVVKLHRDTSKPNLKFSLSGPIYQRGDTIYVTNNTLFNVIAEDSLSGINNNRIYVNYEQVKNVVFGADVFYHVMDTLTDNMGNISILNQLYKRDSEAPVIDLIFSNPPTIDGTMTYPDGTVLFFAITDSTGLNSFKISINGKSITGTTFIGKKGKYKAEMMAIDWLKQSSQKSIEFTIK